MTLSREKLPPAAQWKSSTRCPTAHQSLTQAAPHQTATSDVVPARRQTHPDGWRILSLARSLSVPEYSNHSGIMAICICNNQRHSGCVEIRRMASLQASNASAAASQKPLPRLVRASALPFCASWVAAFPAPHTSNTKTNCARMSAKCCLFSGNKTGCQPCATKAHQHPDRLRPQLPEMSPFTRD